MKINFRLYDPSKEFLLGFSLVEGVAENLETAEKLDVSLFSIGLFLFEISIIW